MKKEFIFLLLLILIPLLFFFKVFGGEVPFPGDLIVGNQEPYKSYSYNGYTPGSIPNKAQGPDVIKELMPWKKFSVESLKKFNLPFWNPYNFSGNPMLANFQSGVFYPLNFIFLIFEFTTAWTVYIFLAPFLSAVLTFFFLKRLKCSSVAAVFGGLVFAFSSYSTVWVEYGNIGHAFVWLPLALLAADYLIEKIDYKYLAGFSAALFLSILAGYIQGVFYIYIITSFFFLAKSAAVKKFSVRKMLIFCIALFLPVLLSSFQLLPTLEMFSNSTRGNYSLTQISKMLNPVYYLVTVAVPDFFGNPATRNYWFDGTYIERVSYFGLIPLILALTAILSNLKKIEIKIFAVLLLGSIAITTDFFITRYFYLIPIPVISTTVATRALSIFAFSGAVLSALGFDIVVKNKAIKKALITGLIFTCGTLMLLFFVTIAPKVPAGSLAVSGFKVAQKNLVLPIVSSIAFLISLFIISKSKKTGLVMFIIFAVTIADLFYYFQKITPFAPGAYMYPQTPVIDFIKKNAGQNRFWGYGTAYIESNFQTYDKTFSPEGNDPLHIKSYTELLSASKTGYLPDILPRPDANIAQGFGREELANNPYRQKVLNIAGVKYVLNKDEGIRGEFNPDYITFPQNSYKLVWQSGFWQAYENLQVVPRVMVTDKYIVAKESSALRRLFSPGFDERTQVLLYDDPKIIPSNDFFGQARFISYAPNRVEIKTSANSSSLLFISDNYYPGWLAQVDGRNAKIYLADYTFRAVSVPEGVHKVVFYFRPDSFSKGLYISALSLVALIVLLLVIKIKKYEI